MNEDWVDSRLATLKPSTDEEPNTAKALAILRGREQRAVTVRRNWAWAATAASIVCLGLVALPGTRALAQRLWDSFFLKRVEVVRVNFDDLPEDVRSLRAEIITGPGKQEAVRDATEAELKAGFRPALPAAGVLSGTPRLSVISAIGGRLTLRRNELSTALDRAGVSDLQVPQGWDGASVVVQVGAMVQAEFPEVSLIQCRPLTLATPPNFDTARLAEIAFRILRLDKQDARHLSERFAANPAWFLGIPQDEQVTVQEVSLRTGPGMYIEDFDEHGQRERVAVVWSTSDKVYALSGKMSRELAILVADSIR